MSKPKRHHFIPKFYINNWNNSKGLVIIYLKGTTPRTLEVQSKDICFEKNLYTKRKGRVDIEVNFFGYIDGNASRVIKILLDTGIDSLDRTNKEHFSLFINTLHARSSEFIKMLRDFNLKRLQKNIQLPLEIMQDNYDDSPSYIEYHAKGKDYNKIVESHWHIFENTTEHDFITSDFPLNVYELGGPDKHGVELPDEFLMTLPISPKKVLIVTNNKDKIKLFIKSPNDFIRKINEATISRANEIIISLDRNSEEFILKRISS